jgi:hypothetical protein
MQQADESRMINIRIGVFPMKLNLRHAVWALALVFTVTVLSAPKFAAAYQSEQGLEHGRGHDKN